MNPLDPTLKRLMRWARPAEQEPPTPAPYGFAARVVTLALRRDPSPEMPAFGIPWVVVGVSLTVILWGGLWLARQDSPLGGVPRFPSGIAALAKNFAP